MKKRTLGALFYPNVPFETLYIPYIYNEIYLDGVYNDVLNQQHDMTILDVGANIGIVTQFMREHAKKVYAIEPSPEHFEALKKNKEFNEWDNVELFNIALADKDGEMEFSLNIGNRTMNTLIIGEELPSGAHKVKGTNYDITTPGHPYVQGLKVKTMAIDTFFKQNKIKHVDFMKFDVEGAEDMILRSDGFKKVYKDITAIEIEFHFPNWKDLVKYLLNLGYEARQYPCSATVLLFVLPA